MHPRCNPSGADPSERAVFHHDIASDIDTQADVLTEAFFTSLKKMRLPAALPRTFLEFQCAVREIMARAVLDEEGFGGALAEMRRRDISEAGQEAVLQTIALVLDKSGGDARKTAGDAIAFAAGLHGLQEGKSQVLLAQENNVVRATISKHVTITQRALGLPPSRGMKDEEAQIAYQARAHEVHETELKHVTKECRLIATSIRRLTGWLQRIAADLQSANDGREGAAFVSALFPPLRAAMAQVENATVV